MEISYNKTFTDYIDDVSTVYYSPSTLASEVGSDAVYAANPAIENHSWFGEGMQRGNSEDKDAYLFANIVLTRNITYPKPKRGSRVKWKDRKSTRLNSSHVRISYAVFCLKKKKK